jgi:hypothetical protein
MGVGSCAIQTGDLVVRLQGVAVPMIMRRAGEYYTLVAPAHVHGMMDENEDRLQAPLSAENEHEVSEFIIV